MDLMEPFQPFVNTMICEPNFYERLSHPAIALNLKVKIGSLFGLKVIADSCCDRNRAYLFDSAGVMHTLILEE